MRQSNREIPEKRGPPAFVLGLGENGYGIVRSLARAGIPVVGFYSGPDEYGRVSKYCEALPLPPAFNDEQICTALIERAARAVGAPILIPTADSHASLLARCRNELAPHFRFHWVHAEALQEIVDKARMSQVCRAAGITAPVTHVTRRDENLAEAAARFSFPCLVKPNRSFDSPFPPRLKNFLAGSPAELLAFYQAHPALKGTTVWQEIIEGGDDNVYQCTVLIGDSGTPEAVFCARKLHQYPPGYGVMCFGRSETNAEVTKQALQLLHAMNYRGVASLEFKYRPSDGRYYFIEMNPRLPWYSALFADAGVNISHLAYLDLTEQKPRSRRAAPKQRDDIHWISLKLDLGWLLQMLKQGRGGPVSWLRSAARARSYAWFDPGDPRPFLRATLGLAGTAIRLPFQARQKSAVTQTSTLSAS